MSEFTVAECRSCHRPVIWAKTTTGASMPVDAEPVDGGNVELLPKPGAAPDAVVHGQPPLLGGELRLSHFVTCPDAGRWRRR